MTLSVNTDSYISLVDADAYLENQYLLSDSRREAWSRLAESDKEILLRKAVRIIDRQPLVGRRALAEQPLAFPRAIYTTWIYGDARVYGNWYVQPEIPEGVCWAQVEIALQLAEGVPERIELQRQGVKSVRLGNLAESYHSGPGPRIISEVALEYLRPFLVGSANIC